MFLIKSVKRRMRILKQCLLVSLFFAYAVGTEAQNINVPNKNGPLGTQVNTLTGNLFLSRTDVYVPARGIDIDLTFYYNSFNYNQNLGFGNGWSFNYSIYYTTDSVGNITLTWGDGRQDIYSLKSNGEFNAPAGIFDSLSQYQSGKYLLITKFGMQYYFDNNTIKRLTKIIDPNSNFLNFSYTDTLLSSMTNAAGQSITLTYNSGFLSSMVDAIASPTRTYSYHYDGFANLTQVADPIGGSFNYQYLVNGPLSEIKDKNSNVADIIYFPDFTVSELIGCNSRKSFSYDTTNLTSIVTDYLPNSTNQVTTYSYIKNNNKKIYLNKITGSCCGYNMEYNFDVNGNITSSIDAKGNVYNYTYDNKGNLLTEKNPLNEVNTYTYTQDFNHITGYTDANGNTYSYTYDSRGNPLQFTGPGNLIFTSTYSQFGDFTSTTDPKGNTFNFTYDAFGNATQVTGPLSYSGNMVFDARGNILSIKDPSNVTFTVKHDLLNRITSITDALNQTVLITYDNNNNVSSVTNKNGNTLKFVYDASNRLVQTIDALGKQSTYLYDAMNNILKFTDRNNNSTSFNYDNLNRLISAVDALGNTYSFSYDVNGNRISSTLPNGNAITNTFDKLNRLVSSSDANGNIGSVQYDKNSNITSFTNATGATVSASYDALDRLINIVDPLGNTNRFAYDNNSNPISSTDRNNHTASYLYDALNRIIAYTDNNGFVTSANYDASGNLTTLSDQNSHNTSYNYDVLNRVASVIYPDGSSSNLSFDQAGNIVSKKQTDGSTINYQYDAENRMVSKSLSGNNIYSYGYDATGRIVSATNANGAVTFAYDALNRLASESFMGHSTFYTYNTIARKVNILYPDGSNVTKNFDTRGRLISIVKGNTTIASYQYNNSNQIMQASFSNGVISNWQYDAANRLSNISTSNGNIQNSSFSYDNEMNKISVTKNNLPQTSEQFSYDANNRLIKFTQGSLQNSYTYDNVGNRTTANLSGINNSYASNSLNQYININNGSQNINFNYDNNGNLTFDGNFYKTYDAEGRLLSDSSALGKMLYQYDALGRRIQKSFNGKAINYYYSGLQQLEQRDAKNDTVLNETIFSGSLAPVMFSSNHLTFFYHQNDLKSVEAITDSTGSLIERYLYDAYGKTTILDASNNILANSKIGNRFGFTAQEYDSETGTYHFHFRNYSPLTGSFNQRDPIGYGDGTSMYQYVHNNPANYVDMLGLQPCPPPGYQPPPPMGFLDYAGQFSNFTSFLQVGDVTGHFKFLNKALNNPYVNMVMLPINIINLENGVYSLYDNWSRNSNADNFDGVLGNVSTAATVSTGAFGMGTFVMGAGAHSLFTAITGSSLPISQAAAGSTATGAVFEAMGTYGSASALGGGGVLLFASAGVAGGLGFYGLVNWGVQGLTGKTIYQNAEAHTGLTDWVMKNVYESTYNDINDLQEHNHWVEQGKFDKYLEIKRRMEEREKWNRNHPNPQNDCPPNGNNGGTQKKYPPGFVGPIPFGPTVLGPHDPNLIVGPLGEGTPQWISVNDAMPYTIYYENSKSASAPAKVVRINYPIDPKEDMSNFSLGNFGFNNLNFNIPPNTPSYYTRLDVRDSLGLYVDVTAGLDVVNHQIFWTFASIDPATQLPTTDPTKGFLLLSDSTKQTSGHGFVNFNIKPLPTDKTGDTIHATAYIVFDRNDTMPTNVAKNTIDAVAPTSHINPLQPINNNNIVSLSWSGNDDQGGSGLQSYSLYVSSNGGAFSVVASGLTRKDTTFLGANNTTYSFYVLATDSTGNTEQYRPGSETSVLIKSDATITNNNGLALSCKIPTTTLTATGGGTYLWSTGATTDSIIVGTAGIYTVTVKSPIGFITSASDTITFDNTVSSAAINTPVTTVLTCSTTSISLTATGGSSYSWSNGTTVVGTAAAFNVTAPGTYTVTVSGSNGCSATASQIITQNSTLPSAPTVIVVDNCNNTSTLIASGYTGTLLWSDGGTDNPHTVSTAGVYTVTQTINGCTSPASSNATAAPKAILAAPTVVVVDNCNNTSTLTASGYTGTLLWSDGGTDNPHTVSTAGVYTVTQTINGCTSPASSSASAAPNTAPAAPSVGLVYNCNSTATLTASGYTGTLLWSDGGFDNPHIVTATAIYTVTQTVNGCTSPASSSVTVSAKSMLSIPSAPTVIVVDNCNNTSTLTASNYLGALLWSDGGTDNPHTVSTAGVYTVTQTTNGCTSPASTNATAAPKTAPIAAINTPATTVLTCSTTSISLTATGGSTYSWSNGTTVVGTAATLNVTAPGNYTVTVSAVNGCSSSASQIITQNSTLPSAPTVIVVDNCNNTSTLTASGYTGTLLWSDGGTDNPHTVSTAGVYSVTQTINGCTSTASSNATAAPKTAPAAPSVGLVYNCNSTATLTASGYTGTLLWSDGGFDNPHIVSATAIYTVIQTVNGCTSPASSSVTVSAKSMLSIPSAPTVIVVDNCNNTSTLTASGYTGTLLWSDGGTDNPLTVSTAGVYTVTQTINGCNSPASSNATAAPKTAPVAAINTPATTVLTCSTTSISLTATGGSTYSWSNGTIVVGTAATLNVTAAGTYTVTVTGANGCSATASQIITQNATVPVAAINTPATTVLTCSTTSISLTATGGSTYSWSNGTIVVGTAATLNVTAAGTYTATVTGANGCSATASQIITQNATVPVAAINTPATTVLTCSTTSISLTATGGTTYSWSNGTIVVGTAATLSVTVSGTYTVTVSAANGCSSTASQIITQNITTPVAAINTPATTVLTCSTTSISLTATGGTTYSWSNGTTVVGTAATLNVTAAGTYTVTVTGANGCSSTSSQTITQNSTLPVAAINTPATTVLTCSTTSISLTATGGTTYSWSNGTIVVGTAATLNVTAAGTYTVTVTGANGCSSTSSQTITQNSSLPSAPTVVVVDNCNNTSTLTASGYTGTLLWSDGGTDDPHTVSIAGVYTVTQTINGCTSPASTNATAAPKTAPIAAINIPATTVLTCTTASISLTATGGSTYSWSNGTTVVGTAATLNVTAPGNYTVTVSAVNGCSSTASQIITQNSTLPSAPTVIVVDNCNNTSTSIASGYTGTLLWSDGGTNNPHTVSTAGVYTVKQTINGCTSMASTTVTATPKTTPAAPVATNGGAICSGSTISLMSSNVAGAIYMWTGPNVFTSSIQNPFIANATIAASGLYSVTVSVNGCMSLAGTTSVTVNPSPNTPTINTIIQPTCTLATGTVVLSGLPAGKWIINPGTVTGNSSSKTISGLAAGSYNFTVTNSIGCISLSAANVVINPAPAATLSMTCPPAVNVLVNPNKCYASNVNLGAPITSGCGTLILTNDAPVQFPVGTRTVTWTLKSSDKALNPISCQQIVTVTENIPPTIVRCAFAQSTSADSNCRAIVPDFTGTLIANDNCTPVSKLLITQSPVAGTSVSIGITPITIMVQDASGNSNTCTTTFTVTDNTPPILNCPANMNANAGTNCTTIIQIPNPTFSDKCDVVTALTWNMTGATKGSSSSSGINYVGTSTFNKGITNINYTAKDAAGNKTSNSFTVTVSDNTAPTIYCPASITVSSGNNCSIKVIAPNPTYTDNCGVTSLTWTMSGATTNNSSSKGINYVGKSVFNTGITTITYTAIDAANNSTTCSFNVTVTSTNAKCIVSPPVIASKVNDIVMLQPVISSLTLHAFPNPSKNYFNLTIKSESKDNIDIRVLDISGKLIQHIVGPIDQTYHFGERFAKGMYMVEVIQSAQRGVVKVIKE